MRIIWKAHRDGAWFCYRLNDRGVMGKRPRLKITPKHGFSQQREATTLMWEEPEAPITNPDCHFPKPSWLVAHAGTVDGAMAVSDDRTAGHGQPRPWAVGSNAPTYRGTLTGRSAGLWKRSRGH